MDHNLMEWFVSVWFVPLCSIGSEIELTQSPVFDLVQLPNSIELNPWIEWLGSTDSSSISERWIDQVG